MSEETHDHSTPEGSTFVHRARYLTPPIAAVAATLTVFHEEGMAFTIGAVCFWLLAVLFLFSGSMHDWKACSHCDQPPTVLSTPERRARLARGQHNAFWKFMMRLLLFAMIIHAILPKPYLDPWWAKAASGVVYFVVAMLVQRSATGLSQHQQYAEECHIDWCRAGLKRKPGMRWRQRRAMWMGHYGMWWIIVLAPLACAVGLYSVKSPTVTHKLGYGFLLMLLIIIVTYVCVDHAMEPCVHCAKNLPSNGGEAAEKRSRWLRLFHVTRYPVLAGAFIGWTASWMLAGTILAKVLVCLAALAVMFWAVLERLHSPVKPWCPWCRDDGGEEAGADTPDPVNYAPSSS